MIRYLLAHYRKAIWASVGAGIATLAWALLITSPGHVTSDEWYAVVLAIVGGATGPAMSKPNAPKRVRPHQGGYSAIELIIAVILLILLIWLVLALVGR